jgi:hypothetical protein
MLFYPNGQFYYPSLQNINLNLNCENSYNKQLINECDDSFLLFYTYNKAVKKDDGHPCVFQKQVSAVKHLP